MDSPEPRERGRYKARPSGDERANPQLAVVACIQCLEFSVGHRQRTSNLGFPVQQHPTSCGRTDRPAIQHPGLKREDLAGPGTPGYPSSSSAQALLDGYTHVITQGVYLTNSRAQFAAASRVAGLTPDSVSHP